MNFMSLWRSCAINGDKTGERRARLDLVSKTVDELDAQRGADVALGDGLVGLVAAVDKVCDGRADGGDGLAHRPVPVDREVDLVHEPEGSGDGDALRVPHERPALLQRRLVVVVDDDDQLAVAPGEFLGSGEVLQVAGVERIHVKRRADPLHSSYRSDNIILRKEFHKIKMDSNLFKSDIKNYRYSLECAKKMPITSDARLVFHLFWRVPRDFGRKQAVAIKSIVVAHLGRDIEINLWSNVELSENPHFIEISGHVRFRKWDLEKEINQSILANQIDPEIIHDEQCYLESDLFRILVLHKYGGFYIDMDVLVLRDMMPLNHMEFVYQWGTSGHNNMEPVLMANNAVMRLEKRSRPGKNQRILKIFYIPTYMLV